LDNHNCGGYIPVCGGDHHDFSRKNYPNCTSLARRAMTRRAMNVESAGQRPIGNEEFRSEWQRAAEGVARNLVGFNSG